jgi:hypothetical protein
LHDGTIARRAPGPDPQPASSASRWNCCNRYQVTVSAFKMLWWPPFLCAESAVSNLSYFLSLTTQQRIATFGPSQDCGASRQHFDGASTCIRSILFVVRCNQNEIYRAEEQQPPQRYSAICKLDWPLADLHSQQVRPSTGDIRTEDGAMEGEGRVSGTEFRRRNNR